jgi:hypothetical protein
MEIMPSADHRFAGVDLRDLSPEERGYIDKATRWSREHPTEITADDTKHGFDLARLDVYSRLPHLQKRLTTAFGYNFGAEVYGHLIALSAFELQFGSIRRFVAFKVLMVSLLGKAVGQYLPSLYLAAALHPAIGPTGIDVEEACDLIRDAEHYR